MPRVREDSIDSQKGIKRIGGRRTGKESEKGKVERRDAK